MGIADIFKKKAIYRVPMKVCMMGPRAVGKTTILTAIFSDTQENLGMSTNLKMLAIGDTEQELTTKKHLLNSIFANRQQITDRPIAGIEASSTVNTFDFEFGLKGKEPRIDMEIKDFPGEYVVSKPDEVKGFINDSSAIFLAIDTPHLMEYGGRFCEVKNKPSAIINFFNDCIANLNGEKLVLLVPLKCEKYFHERRMDEVLQRCQEVYGQLIDMFKKSGKVACAVTPILTLGDVVYDKMANDGGSVRLNEQGCPEEVLYKFHGDAPKYSPAFCVQPLYYMLSFLSSLYARKKKNRNIFDILLGKIFDLFDSDEEFFNEILNMENHRITEGFGYNVLCGHDLFKYCK